MKTRINLYLPELRPVKEVLPLSSSVLYMVMSVVITLCIIGGFSYVNQQLRAEQQILNSELIVQESRLTEKAAELAAVTTNTPLLKKIDKTKADIIQKDTILEALKHQFAVNVGFAELFTGLAEIEMKDVWLTDIKSKSGKLSFTGKALDAETVPQWITAIEASPIFMGQSFSTLELLREDTLVTFTLHNDNPLALKEAQ